MLTKYQKAPLFTLESSEQEQVSLTSFLGKKVVLYFYPKDDTPGCTAQACAFRGSYDAFENAGATIIGISKDSVRSHSKFKQKYQLPFILLSDSDASVQQTYGVWVEKSMFGKKYMGTKRTTFLIDEQGQIEAVYENASPIHNASEILAYLQAGH